MVQYLLQQVLGLTPLFTGLAYLPLTATVFTISYLVLRLMTSFGPRKLLSLGDLLVTVSLLGLPSWVRRADISLRWS